AHRRRCCGTNPIEAIESKPKTFAPRGQCAFHSASSVRRLPNEPIIKSSARSATTQQQRKRDERAQTQRLRHCIQCTNAAAGWEWRAALTNADVAVDDEVIIAVDV